jgi:hypothetical protein
MRLPVARRRLPVWLVVGMFMALAVESSALSAPSTTLQSWFDAPLPASQHPLGPIAVTTHSTAPGGISAVELFVDGTSFATQEFADAPRLATAAFDWQPTEERAYWLVVRGQSGGQWGPPASILVIIGTLPGSPSPTASPGPSVTASPTPTAALTSSPPPTASPTASPSPRPTPTRTPQPTPTPLCTPRAPTLTAPHNHYFLDDPFFNPPTFKWTDESTEDCVATGFRIQVARSNQFNPAQIVAQGNVGNTRVHEWTPPDALPDCQEGPYYWRVRPKRADGSLGPPSDVWQLFVSTFACGG